LPKLCKGWTFLAPQLYSGAGVVLWKDLILSHEAKLKILPRDSSVFAKSTPDAVVCKAKRTLSKTKHFLMFPLFRRREGQQGEFILTTFFYQLTAVT
jgi:hypothetical protein